jgi:alpha-L-fucosidase
MISPFFRVLSASALSWALAGALVGTTWAQQPSVVKRQDVRQTSAETAQEQTESAPTSARDAAAIADAQNGWYKAALVGKDARLAWWREARFGCFVHWGPYSVLGGEWQGKPNPGYAEHIMRVNRIPYETYKAEVAANFRPEAFDATEWVRTIKAAGMRYVILTSKHHDGFALWPSDANSYNIRDTSRFKRDPLKELVDAAHAEGIRVGFYYSHAFDWADPNAPGNDWDYDNPGGGRNLYGGVDWYNQHPELLPRIHKYVLGKAIPQLQELVSRYHPDILWFDTPGKLPLFEQIAIVKAVRAAGPNVVINGRAARGDSVNFGDYQNTADRPAELRATAGDWEAIPTTNESYGWNKLDNSYKPTSYFVQLLAKAAAKGGNLLLNIGPRGDGTLNPPDVTILKNVGTWMDINAESIRGTERTPLERQVWGESTRRGDKLYLHVFAWPKDGKLVVGGLRGKVTGSYLLADAAKRSLMVSRQNESDMTLSLPGSPPDVNDSVVVLTMQPGWSAVAGRLLSTQADNTLLGFDGKAVGAGFSYGDGKTARDYVDGLERSGNRLDWMVRVEQPAVMQVSVQYSTPVAAPPLGTQVVIEYEGQILRGELKRTQTERTMTMALVGDLKFKDKGPHLLSVRMEGSPQTVHFFEVNLTPKQP